MDSDAQPFPWPLRNNCKTSSLATVAAYLTRLEALDPKLKLSALPRGYKLLEQQRRDSLHTDRYLYGHPSGHQFRSAIEFLPHCQFLFSGRTTQCICKLCVPKQLRKTLAPKTNGKKQYGEGNNSNLSDLSIKNYLQKSKTNLTRKRIQWRKENAMKTLDLDSNDGSMLTDLDSQQDLESTSTTSSALTSLDAADLESVSTRDDDISILTDIDQLVGWDSDVSEALEFVALGFSRLRKQQQQWKSQQPTEKSSHQSRGYDTDVSELTDLEEQIGWESDTTSALSDCDGDKFSCWDQKNHLTAAGKQIILQSVSLAYSLVGDDASTCRECGNRIQGVFIEVDEIPFHWQCTPDALLERIHDQRDQTPGYNNLPPVAKYLVFRQITRSCSGQNHSSLYPASSKLHVADPDQASVTSTMSANLLFRKPLCSSTKLRIANLQKSILLNHFGVSTANNHCKYNDVKGQDEEAEVDSLDDASDVSSLSHVSSEHDNDDSNIMLLADVCVENSLDTCAKESALSDTTIGCIIH